MYRRRRLPLSYVAVAACVGVVSGNYIFGPPLAHYWASKAAKDEDEPRRPAPPLGAAGGAAPSVTPSPPPVTKA